MMVVGTRKTAEIRREEILDAACEEFAQTGLHGTSADAIARRAGVSQPYLFRLFGTKRELFIATVQRCFAETAQTFEHAALGKTGEDALKAMAGAYTGSSPTAGASSPRCRPMRPATTPRSAPWCARATGGSSSSSSGRRASSESRVRDFFAARDAAERDGADGSARLLGAVGEAADRVLLEGRRPEADLFF